MQANNTTLKLKAIGGAGSKTIMISLIHDNLLEIKSELLCWGVRLEESALSEALKKYPYLLDEKFIHGAHLTLEERVLVNACFSEEFVYRSPYEIKIKYGDFVLHKFGRPLCTCDIISAPGWYEKQLTNGLKMSDIFRQHGYDILADACYIKCDFFNSDAQCLFCSFPNANMTEDEKKIGVRETFVEALKDIPQYAVWFSEGARSSSDRGACYLSELVRVVKEISKTTPVSVELAPPKDDKFIELLFDSGANSIIMNLELYDDSLRKVFCPGKSMISKKRYDEAWSYAVQLLGEGNVGSVLIVGLERKEMTIKAAENMVAMGVIPTIVAFRPYDNCLMRNFPRTSPRELMYVSRTIGSLLRNSGLCSKLERGCMSCGGCSLEIDWAICKSPTGPEKRL